MRWREVIWAAIAVIATGLAASLWFTRQPSPAAPLVAQFDVALPPQLAGGGFLRLSLSPNGQWLAMAGPGTLYLRSQNDGSTVAGPDVEQGGAVVWSPDGSAFLYTTEAHVMRFQMADRSSSMVADLPDAIRRFRPLTMAWSTTGDVVVADSVGRVMHFSIGGGTVQTLIQPPERPSAKRTVGFLPDSQQFFFVDLSPDESTRGLYRASTAASSPVRIDSQPWLAGGIVGRRSLVLRRDTSIVAQALTEDGLSTQGAASVITADVGPERGLWAVSLNGMLVYAPSQSSRLQRFDRSGAARELIGTAGPWSNLDVDAAGRRVVAARSAGATSSHLWVLDLERNTEERLTFGVGRDSDPAWDHEGRAVAFDRGPGLNVSTDALVARSGQPPRVIASDPGGVALDDWSPDGKWLVYHHRSGLTQGRFAETLYAMSAGSNKPGEPAAECRGGIADQARFSPDGRWLAYNCNESGRFEIYVVPFRREGDRVRVSVDGGMQPTWQSDQSELYFLAPDGTMMAVRITTTPAALTAGPPTALFSSGIRPVHQVEQYGPLSAERGFVLRLPAEGSNSLRFLLNWPQRLISPEAR